MELDLLRLVKCKKCGAVVMSTDTLIQSMMDTIHELNEKARKATKYTDKQSFLGEASSVTALMKQVLHHTYGLEERKNNLKQEKSVLVNYLLENELITKEKLNELDIIARERARILNIEEEKQINVLYGSYHNFMANMTKRDDTASQAINRLSKN
jgi:hypothetical protein